MDEQNIQYNTDVSSEASKGALWWQDNWEKYEYPNNSNEYGGKIVAVGSRGVIDSDETLEGLVDKMARKGLKVLHDYYATPCEELDEFGETLDLELDEGKNE